MGNIPINTSIETFLQNLYSDRNLIKIYAKESDITPIYDGLSGTRSNLSQTLATGFKVELYESSEDTTMLDTIYLSVLGDINGDGMINASDGCCCIIAPLMVGVRRNFCRIFPYIGIFITRYYHLRGIIPAWQICMLCVVKIELKNFDSTYMSVWNYFKNQSVFTGIVITISLSTYS